MKQHNKQKRDTERLYYYLAKHFNIPRKFEDFVLLTQINQGLAIKYGVEHWRRRMPKTGGALFWQFNDCWPVTSWSVVDYYHRLKPAYYFMRRAYAPVLVSLREEEDGSIGIWLTNDTLKELKGKIILKLEDFEGKVSTSEELEVSVPANMSKLIKVVTFHPKDKRREFVSVQFIQNGRRVGQNSLFFSEFKHLDLLKSDISVND